MSEWVSVDGVNQLPKLGAFVLFCRTKSPYLPTTPGAYIGNKKFLPQGAGQACIDITHWMYFPETPL